jgi:hypothetical protein
MGDYQNSAPQQYPIPYNTFTNSSLSGSHASASTITPLYNSYSANTTGKPDIVAISGHD